MPLKVICGEDEEKKMIYLKPMPLIQRPWNSSYNIDLGTSALQPNGVLLTVPNILRLKLFPKLPTVSWIGLLQWRISMVGSCSMKKTLNLRV